MALAVVPGWPCCTMHRARGRPGCRPKGRHDADRTAKRHGHTGGEVTLGGRRVPVSGRASGPSRQRRGRPGVLRGVRFARSARGGRAGADARRGQRPQEPACRGACRRGDRRGLAVDEQVGDVAPFVAGPARVGAADLARPRRGRARGADDRRDRARGHDATSSRWGSRPTGPRSRSGCGKDRPRTRPSRPRYWPTSSSAASTRRAGMLFVSTAPRRSQGRPESPARALVQRCQRHKERNVVDHLPERERRGSEARLRRAWDDPDHAAALAPCGVAAQLARVYPGRRRLAARGARGDADAHPSRASPAR